MCGTHQESAFGRYVCVCLFYGPSCMCVFSMTWQPPALFKHGVGCAGSLIVRLGLPLVHAVPGTLWRGKEGAQRGQAASNTSPTEPKDPLVGLWTTRTGPGRHDNEDQYCVTQETCRDTITGSKQGATYGLKKWSLYGSAESAVHQVSACCVEWYWSAHLVCV